MEYIKKFREENGEKILLYVLVSFLSGIIIGFVFSPVKKGVAVGSHNGSYNKLVDSNNVESTDRKKRRKFFGRSR